MENFWDFSVWGDIHLFAAILLSLLVANAIKRAIPFLRASLIPTSVLGGVVLILLSGVYKLLGGEVSLYDTPFFCRTRNGDARDHYLPYFGAWIYCVFPKDS